MDPDSMVRSLASSALALLAGCSNVTSTPVDASAYLAQWRHSEVATPAQSAPRPSGSAGELTVADAVDLALVTNPTARALRLEAGARHAGADVAGDWDNPRLSAELRHAVSGQSSPWFVAAGLSFTIPLSARHARRQDHALALASRATLAAAEFEWTLVTSVRAAWLDWSFAVRAEELLRDYVKTLEGVVEVGEKMSAAGELALGEQGVLPIELGHARLELSAAALRSTEGRTRLLALLGLAPQAPVRLVVSLDSTAPPARAPESWPRGHVRVALAQSGVAVADESLRLELARRAPDLTLGPTVEWDQGETSVGVGVSMPIPSLDLNRRRVAEARGHRKAARVRVELAIQALEARRDRLVRRTAVLQSRLDDLRALEAKVDAQFATIESLLRQGELDVLLLRDALRQTLRTRLAVARTRRDLGTARAELRALHEVSR